MPHTKLKQKSQVSDRFAIARRRMVKEQLEGRGISDQRVLSIMGQIRRHDFVDEALKPQAYIDAPLNIGYSQTISQPYIVALMTQSLELTGQESILEIGTGCGYQATILSKLAKKVYAIERVKELGLLALNRFKIQGLRNIVMRIGDGSQGWPEKAPYDRILSACAAPDVPQVLLDQLKVGGIMILPVAKNKERQTLIRVKKLSASQYKSEDLGDCLFVKMIGKHGY